MPVLHCLAPYEPLSLDLPGPARRVILDRATPEIFAAGGYWEESEQPGNQALVRVRANQVTLNRITRNLPITVIEDLDAAWQPVRPRAINRGGEIAFDGGVPSPCKPLAELRRDVLTDQESGELQRRADLILQRLTTEPYIRLTGLDWHDASKLLGYLAQQGAALDRVSTGTFPTTGVLDTGVRANENPLSDGGNWTNPMQSGNSNLQITSNQIDSTAGTSDTDANAYRSNTTYGSDQEMHVTMATRPDKYSYGYLGCVNPGAGSLSGYFIFVNHLTPANCSISRIDSGSFTTLGASISQAFSNGDAVGAERLSGVIGMYRKTGGSWATVATRSDSTYTAAGSIGFGDKASSTAGKYGDFGGGTVATAATERHHTRRMIQAGGFY